MVEKVFQGLQNPSSMAFLGPNDILVLEKNQGTVSRIVDGKMLSAPLLEVDNIGKQVEWGMLGIAINNNESSSNSSPSPPVFLYYTENQTITGNDGGVITRNHLYRYELSSDKTKLENPQLLLDLPATSLDPQQENNHDGGKVVIGPDHNLYAVIGDVGSHDDGQAQNVEGGVELDGTSGMKSHTRWSASITKSTRRERSN